MAFYHAEKRCLNSIRSTLESEGKNDYLDTKVGLTVNITTVYTGGLVSKRERFNINTIHTENWFPDLYEIEIQLLSM